MLGLGVLEAVVERFLGDAKQLLLQGGVEAPLAPDLEFDLGVVDAADDIDVFLERGREAVGIDIGGAQLEDEGAHLADGALDQVLELAGYDGLREEQKRLREQGILMGIGLATNVDRSGYGPPSRISARGGYESAVVRVEPTGKVTAMTGSSPHGPTMRWAWNHWAKWRFTSPTVMSIQSRTTVRPPLPEKEVA